MKLASGGPACDEAHGGGARVPREESGAWLQMKRLPIDSQVQFVIGAQRSLAALASNRI
jgi:hypothetical protein